MYVILWNRGAIVQRFLLGKKKSGRKFNIVIAFLISFNVT